MQAYASLARRLAIDQGLLADGTRIASATVRHGVGSVPALVIGGNGNATGRSRRVSGSRLSGNANWIARQRHRMAFWSAPQIRPPKIEKVQDANAVNQR